VAAVTFRNVLVADDDASMRHLLAVILRDHGYEASVVADGEEALRELASREYDVLLTDVRMPRMDGLSLLGEVRRRHPDLTVVVMTAYGSHEAAIEAMKAGAYDWVSKPFRPDEVVLVLKKAEERERLARENRRLRSELDREYGLERMVSVSAAMAEVLRQVRKVAPIKTTVLVSGESGTGKELVARAIHQLSPRASLPFVAVNCGAIPAELIESELFGHVKGAFTDATRTKKGLVAEADGGTLFLDEIGELPLLLQVKLLRFLQEEEIRPVGETRTSQVDVRVVAASARDLARAVAQGEFREDLFYRLNVLGIRLPPLRERREDVLPLARHFLARFAALRPDARAMALSPEAGAALEAYGWPGNVRELEHVMERAAVLAEGPAVREADLTDAVREGPARVTAAPGADAPLSIKRAIPRLEEQLIRAAIERTGGNRTRAAELLEISYRALLYKLKEYGIT
jgi:two-component system, NtrC family, response regulator AtoC